MKLSHLQEARHHKEHSMIDEIKQAAAGRRYYERKIIDTDVKDVISMLTRHFGEPALTRERRTFWNMGNDELSVADYPDYIQVYLA